MTLPTAMPELLIDEENLETLINHLTTHYDEDKLVPYFFYTPDRMISLEDIDWAIKLASMLGDGGAKSIDSLVEFGSIMYGNRDYETALHDFSHILVIDKRNTMAYWTLGEIFMKKEKYKSARTLFKHGKELAEEDNKKRFEDSLFNLSIRQAKLPEDVEELVDYLASIGKNTELPSISEEEFTTPTFYHGHFGEEGFYRVCKLLAQNPRDPAPYHFLGQFFNCEKQPQSAKNLLLRGKQLSNPSNSKDICRYEGTFWEDIIETPTITQEEADLCNQKMVEFYKKTMQELKIS